MLESSIKFSLSERIMHFVIKIKLTPFEFVCCSVKRSEIRIPWIKILSMKIYKYKDIHALSDAVSNIIHIIRTLTILTIVHSFI